MMKKPLLTLLCGLLGVSAFAQNSNVPVTGFNADIVADGAVGPGSVSTTASADLASPPYVFVSSTFNPGSGICASGATALPASGTITSINTTNNTGITYQLQSYGNGATTNNNVLRLAATTSGTLTLTTPTAAAKLFLVGMGGSGAASFTAVVNFTDATSETITNAPAMPDWCGGASTYRLTSQIYYRILNNATTCNGGTCQYLYEVPVALSVSNYNKTISSVTLTNNSAGTLLNIFAVGAQAPCAAPTAQPTSLVLTPASTSQINGSFTAATGSPSGYLIVKYPQGATPTAPVSGTTYTAGQSLGLGTVIAAGAATTFSSTGLSGSTSYTYYIYAYNGGTCGGPIYLTTNPLTGTQSTNACGTLSGTVPVGPGLPNTPAGGFTSLTQALTYINNFGLGGNTVLALQTGYDGTSANETFPITFSPNPCIGATKTLTIRPAAGVTGLLITNLSNDAPVIDFNGAAYVTIDGVNNGLTISNTSTASTANTSTIRFTNDATNNTVTNCTVLGSATGGVGIAGGTIYFATGTTTGNDNITISNCKIGPSSTANLPTKGIYSQGAITSAAVANSNITISNNEIYDYFLSGGNSAGLYATSGNTDWNIINNKMYETATRTFTTFATMYGIYFSNATYGQNTQITGNTIGYANNTGTGTFTLDGTASGTFTGILLNTLSTATGISNVNNNILSNIALTSSSGGFTGIINNSSAGSNTININNNQVKNIALTNTTGTVYGISWGSATNESISNNLITNISRTSGGTTYGLYSGSSSTNETINNNEVSNISATPASGFYSLYGIYQNTASGTKVIQNNQVYGFSGTSAATIYGIRIGYGTTIDISGNTVYNLNSTGGSGGSVYGISTGTVGTTFNVYKNKVYNLSMSSTSGTVYGIYNSSSAINAYNNLIGDLSSTAYTSTSSPYIGLAGIYINSGTANLYNNTIRIGTVTSSGTNFSAVGIYANTTPTVLLQNNLVVNLATPTGSGKAVAYQRSGTTLTTYATASNNNAFYAGTPGANNVIFWDGTNAYQDLASYQAAMVNRDQLSLSVNAAFISTTGANATYLHIPAGTINPLESAGTNVSLFNTDYDGNARPGPAGSIYGGALFYDIGADEFDGIPSFTCTTPAPGNTIASQQGICLGSSVTLSLQNATQGNGVSYQWQSSTNGTNYTAIAGATAATYTATPTAVTYYKCTVTCGSTLSATSNPVQITFANSITNTTPGVRCGPGSVNLAATSNSGNTLKWYTAASGGTAVGTGSPFTTPALSTTTDYYVAAEAFTADTIRVGNGTTAAGSFNYPNPLSTYYGGAKHQMLFLASELQAQGLSAGNITSIAFDIATVNTAATCQDFTIRMGSTTATSLSGFLPGTTTAYNLTYTPSVAGTVTFNLTTPFNWDGSSNVIVETVHNAGNSGNGNGTNARYTTTPFNSVYVRYADNVTPAGVASFDAATSGTTAASANRPNIIFGGQKVCSSPRVPVTATINTAPAFSATASQTVCNNAVTTLSVTSPTANYTSYTWNPATGLYTDAAATTPYVPGGNAATVYFKSATAGTAVYTVNAQNNTTQCSAITYDTVIVLPATVTATVTPSSVCMSGTATLSLNPATGYGAAGFQWQSSANNITFTDVAGATNPTYTTPTISTTTYYRAVIKNSAGAACLNSISDTARVYNPQVVSTTPGSRCGTGTITLGATASEGTLSWYANATGGTPLATGPSFTTPSISTTTTYYVSAAIGSPVCEGPRTAVTATVNPNPVASITPAGPVQVCAGNTTTLTASGGDSYQWRDASGNIAGATANVYTTGIAGTYSVIAVTAATGCTDTAAPVTVVVNPLPTVFLGNDTTFCSGNTLTLNAGNQGATYLWDNNSTNQTRSVTTSGTYYVKVTNGNGCVKTDTINVMVNPSPVVNLGNDTTFCHGNTLTLNAGNPGATYLWDNNTTAQTRTVNSTGTYSVKVTNSFGCVGRDTISVTVTEVPSGVINAVHGSPATYTFNVINAQNVSTYTWNFGDGSPTVNGTLVQHTYTTNGIYTVTVTMNGMCNDQAINSRTVDVYDANGTGIHQLEDNKDLVLYPNPAKDLVVLEKRNSLEMKHVSVYNVIGQLIYSAKADSKDKHRLNTSGMASGIYTVRVETEKGFIVRKFEITR